MGQKKDSKGRNLHQGEDQLKDGRYRYRYTDNYGNRKAVYSWKLVKTDKTPQGKKDGLCLREIEKNIENDIEDGILTYMADSTTVYEMILKYLSTKPQIANSTMQNYIHMVDKNIKDVKLGSMKLSEVKKSDIKKFYAYLYEEKKFASSTLQLYQNIIFPTFQMAVDDDVIRKNPCKDCMKDYVRGGLTSTKHPLTRQEQKALLNYVRDSNVYSKYYEMIALMLATGCRVGEVIGLTWNDIDFDKEILSINHQIIYKKIIKEGITKHYVDKPKNRTSRTIPLQKDIIAILSKYKMQTYFMSKSNSYEVDGYSNFIFLNNEMKLYTPNTLTRTFHNIRDSYNKTHDENDGDIVLPDFSAHTFRHTFCTRMAENGMDIKVLQEIMGHKNITVTMQVYNHVLEDRTQAEVERVGSALVV